MANYLIPASARDEFYTQERCFISELCNSPLLPESSLAIARVEAGVTTQLHSLANIAETYIVIEGIGKMEVDEAIFDIVAGDQVVIPPGSSQRVTAEGDTDLRFYCLCTPRFVPEAYCNLED